MRPCVEEDRAGWAGVRVADQVEGREVGLAEDRAADAWMAVRIWWTVGSRVEVELHWEDLAKIQSHEVNECTATAFQIHVCCTDQAAAAP